jgi:probable rRNA maturation factor
MSDFDVSVQLKTEVPDALLPRLEAAAVATLEHEGVAPPAALSVLLAGDDYVHRLNRDFRGVDKPTDVLSFPTGDAMPGDEHYLGDVAIAVPVARAQAEAGGHSLEAELILLTIHGVLHLLEHDHVGAEEKAAMWAAQAAVLADLGVAVQPPVE